MTNNAESLRTIKTARTKKAINKAAKRGYWPLMKPVIPSPEIKSKVMVLQHKATGEIELVSDYRMGGGGKDYEVALDFQWYYPHKFKNPYAAYLIPPDIEVGEKVWLEDLIEDIVGGDWNQGDTWRRESGEATWNGEDFDIDAENMFRNSILG